LAMDRSQRHSYVVKDKVDQYMLALPVAAGATVQDIDAGYMSSGVSNGTPIASSNSNVDDTANAIIEKLNLNNGAMDRGLFWAVYGCHPRGHSKRHLDGAAGQHGEHHRMEGGWFGSHATCFDRDEHACRECCA
jgi:hypothetical protein